MITITEHMELWRKKEPWFYSPLVFNNYIYFLIFGAILSLTIINIIVYPVIHNIAALFIGYFLAQFIFQMGHMTTHALYVESPVEDWEPGVFVAYLHHYEHPKAIYKYWLNHRLNFLMQTKGSTVAYGVAWILPFLLFGKVILPLYSWYLFWFAMVEPVHEYYHVPKDIRKSHFSGPMYYWLRSLEYIGLLDEQHHLEHHKHSLKNMEKVTKFSDLYSPFADAFFDYLWAMALKVKDKQIFKIKPIRKTIYLQGTVLLPLVFSFSSFVFLYATKI